MRPSRAVRWPHQCVALSLYTLCHRPTNAEAPSHRYKEQYTKHLQTTHEVEVVVQVTNTTRLSVRPTVDVSVIVRSEPDAFKPSDDGWAEQTADTLWEPVECHDDALHWPRCIDICQLQSCMTPSSNDDSICNPAKCPPTSLQIHVQHPDTVKITSLLNTSGAL